MKAKEYLSNAIEEGIKVPVYFRGFNHCWESDLIPIGKAIETLENELTEYIDIDIELSQSGINEEFPDYMCVYFLD